MSKNVFKLEMETECKILRVCKNTTVFISEGRVLFNSNSLKQT